MTAAILPFKRPQAEEPGLTYVMPLDQDDGLWLLYRQPPDVEEPHLLQTFAGMEEAARVGRIVARRHGDRFVLDEGVL